MKEQDYHKVDYTSGKNELTGKANRMLMRTKGKKVFNVHREKFEYVKMWR